MKIKDDYGLANVMSRALMGYANKVQRGATAPYKPFLMGETSVTVTMSLRDDGSINVETAEDTKALRKTVREQNKKIEDLEALQKDMQAKEEVFIAKVDPDVDLSPPKKMRDLPTTPKELITKSKKRRRKKTS